MPFFSRFKNKGAQPSSKGKSHSEHANGSATEPRKPKWQASWNSKSVVPEEVEELVHACTAEMKKRGMLFWALCI
jgi:ribosome assembly protein YihI (activator of Der GTPase)